MNRLAITVSALLMLGFLQAPFAAAAGLTLSESISNNSVSQSEAKTPTLLAAQTKPSVNSPASPEPVITLGIGDTVAVDVYGKPEFSSKNYIADNGTVLVPLVGQVPIAGLSPADAGTRIAKAFKDGEYLVDPQVSVTVIASRNLQVSVLGAVAREGRYAVEPKTSIFDLLALAGGTSIEAGDDIVLLRPAENGAVDRIVIKLSSLTKPGTVLPPIRFRVGDAVYVPKAGKFYVQGEVVTPKDFVLTDGTTVTEAISRAGGITRRGSSSRVEIRRKQPDGSYRTFSPKPNDLVMPDDVIRVKESIF